MPVALERRDPHADAAGRLCWKQSRHRTGRPCVGLNGTVVSLPHCEHTARVSVLEKPWCPEFADPRTATRFALQVLHRLGSFLNCLSWKNNCSPEVKTKSVPQSTHFNILSWNSIEDAPSAHSRPTPTPMSELSPPRARVRRILIHPPQLNCPWIRPAMPLARTWITADVLTLKKPRGCAYPATLGMRCEKGRGRTHEEERPDFDQSCSFRAFFRLRLRANASFTRFFSPGFR